MARDAAVLTDPSAGDDEIAAQSQHWTNALCELGFAVRRIASGDADEIRAGLNGCALALVENVCSVATDPDVSRTSADELSTFVARGGSVVLHHHDLPWQPDWSHHADSDLPPRLSRAMHVGVSLRAQRDLHARGYAPAVAIHHHFDFDAPSGDRAGTRAACGFADDEIVLYQPTAATRTTNVAGAVRFLQSLHGVITNRPLRYWLRGPIDDDVAATVARLLEHCPVPVTVDASVSARDALAACDVVLLPSTWDRSGGAAVASAIARRPCVVGPFPVLGELRAVGLQLFDLDEPMELVKFLARPSARLFDVNLRRARLSFSAADLPAKIADVLAASGVPRQGAH